MTIPHRNNAILRRYGFRREEVGAFSVEGEGEIIGDAAIGANPRQRYLTSNVVGNWRKWRSNNRTLVSSNNR